MYDVYILSKLKKEDIDFIQLKKACQRTFSYLKTELEVDKIIELLKNFKSDPIQNQQWQNYAKKYSYTQGILLLLTIKNNNLRRHNTHHLNRRYQILS